MCFISKRWKNLPLHPLTIHTLTPMIRTVQAQNGANALALVGQPMRTEAEIIAASADLREEIARVGRLLADKLGFDYPTAAEVTVRRTWQELRNESRVTSKIYSFLITR